MQAEVAMNLNEILRLHEDILSRIKIIMSYPSVSARHSTGSDSRRSFDTVKAGNKGHTQYSTRHAMEKLWVKQFRTRYSTSRPQDAAAVAKVFGNVVR